jgi:predicted Rossmann-fold nucleotide-binding protein
MRKLHFLLRAVAVVAFPGGFGTLDEIFTGLTLCQTGKSQRLPIILFGREYWEKCLNMEHLAKTGMISEEDLDILFYANTPEEAVEIITDFYGPTPK